MIPVSNIEFLSQAFFRLTNDESFWVTGFAGDPYKVPHYYWAGKGAPPGLPGFIQPHHNNFVCVSSFRSGKDGKVHRRKANFSRMFMVMVDDVGTKVPEQKILLTPSAVVETSPDNFQAWYFLDPPETEAERANGLIDGMIAGGLTADATDPGMRGVTRYGRLPMGHNGKAKYVERLGNEFVQRVALWKPSHRYSLDDIAKSYGIDLAAHRVSTKGAPRRPAVMPLDGHADIPTRLAAVGLYLGPVPGFEGAHNIVCPWVREHTDHDPGGTVYFEPSDENAASGGFKCHHGHCMGRTIADLRNFLAALTKITLRNGS